MCTPDAMNRRSWPWRSAEPGWLRIARETRNPLLRGPTRGERLAARAAAALVTIAMCAAAVLPALVYRVGVAKERADSGRRPVRAIVASQAVDMANRGLHPPMTLLNVTYPFRDMTHRGTVSVPSPPATGTRITVWVSPEGGIVPKPQGRCQTIVQTILAVLGGLLVLAGIMWGGPALLAAWSIRLRSQEWEKEWLAFDIADRPPRP